MKIKQLMAGVFGLLLAVDGWAQFAIAPEDADKFARATIEAYKEFKENGVPVLVNFVVDGDTLDVGAHTRIRLANIDAPEISHGYGRPGQPYGQAAKAALIAKLKVGGVRLKCLDVDRYGRQVCEVYQEKINVNRWLVENGFAWANTASGRYLRDRQYLVLQEQAKAAHKGLWAEPDPIAPWQWRVKQ